MVPPNARMTIEWFVPLGQARPLTMALHSLAAEVRTFHGCMGCSVSTDLANQGTVRYIEDWRTEDDLQARLRAETFAQLATLIEDAINPPRVEFSLPSGTRGLDYVEEVQRVFARKIRAAQSHK
jgi:quinol monooxygenase YgiN